MLIENIPTIASKAVRLCSLFLILVLPSSCVGPYMLQYKLKDYKVPLSYEHDTNIDSLKSSRKVCIRVIDNLKTNDTTKVKDNGFLVVPLVIAGGYKGDFTVTLGKSSVTPSFSDFVNHSIQAEANRSGNFIVKKRAFRADYTVIITLVDCQISTEYHKDRIRYSRYSKESWNLKPIKGEFVAEVKVVGRKNLVFEKTYISNKSSQPEMQNFKSEFEMNKKMMDDFARTASIEIKEILEAVVRDINEIIG